MGGASAALASPVCLFPRGANLVVQHSGCSWPPVSRRPQSSSSSAPFVGPGLIAVTGLLARHPWNRRRLRRRHLAARYFGPCPPEPEMTPEEALAAEFAKELERGVDPRLTDYNDRISSCAESGDWRGAQCVLEDMWKSQTTPDAWMYSMVIDTCIKADETETAEALQQELGSWGEYPNWERFQLAPVVQWDRQLKRAGCCIHNTLDWSGRHPLPTTDNNCWLLPSQDDAAEYIAEYEIELQQCGWRLLTCDPGVVAKLRDKAAINELARSLGLSAYMPEFYSSPVKATYPCILKPTRGTWGKNTHIVYSCEDVLRLTRGSKLFEVERLAEQQYEYRLEMDGQERDQEEMWAEQAEEVDRAVQDWLLQAQNEEVGQNWVLQELVPGHFEYSTSLLVADGEILDAACSRYEYSSETYVWPQLEYLESKYVSVPEGHLDVMRRMLVGFRGICNFNYKLRPCGKMCIFEVNPRVGGDLVFDVPKKRVRAMFEKLDAMFS